MKRLEHFNQAALNLVREGIKTTHGRIVMGGLVIGLCYLPAWLGAFLSRASTGSVSLWLMLAVVFLGLQDLWKQRHQLALTASDEDRLLGHLLILGGVGLFPFCRFALWPQALIWLLILVGIACSSWGLSFFRQYPIPTLLIPLSVYPKPSVTAQLLWEAMTPPRALDRFMAWTGSLALRAIGQPAVSSEAVISLPTGAVEVAWVCNGFNMAMTMAAASLLLGLFLKQSWSTILSLVSIGFFLALAFNIPRIMLMTMAAVYWGEASFKFWHGAWGGQLFSTVLFTTYYYIVMAILKRQPVRS